MDELIARTNRVFTSVVHPMMMAPCGIFLWELRPWIWMLLELGMPGRKSTTLRIQVCLGMAMHSVLSKTWHHLGLTHHGRQRSLEETDGILVDVPTLGTGFNHGIQVENRDHLGIQKGLQEYALIPR